MGIEAAALDRSRTPGEMNLAKPAEVKVRASVAALLSQEAGPVTSYDKPPYWSLEKARIAGSRNVAVELVVNGEAVDRAVVLADGTLRPITFRYAVKRSSWIALRILPSSHTNPVFAIVAGQPIRIRRSIEWCRKAVDQCASQKLSNVKLSERGAAKQAYDYAKEVYSELLR